MNRSTLIITEGLRLDGRKNRSTFSWELKDANLPIVGMSNYKCAELRQGAVEDFFECTYKMNEFIEACFEEEYQEWKERTK